MGRCGPEEFLRGPCARGTWRPWQSGATLAVQLSTWPLLEEPQWPELPLGDLGATSVLRQPLADLRDAWPKGSAHGTPRGGPPDSVDGVLGAAGRTRSLCRMWSSGPLSSSPSPRSPCCSIHLHMPVCGRFHWYMSQYLLRISSWEGPAPGLFGPFVLDDEAWERSREATRVGRCSGRAT